MFSFFFMALLGVGGLFWLFVWLFWGFWLFFWLFCGFLALVLAVLWVFGSFFGCFGVFWLFFGCFVGFWLFFWLFCGFLALFLAVLWGFFGSSFLFFLFFPPGLQQAEAISHELGAACI